MSIDFIDFTQDGYYIEDLRPGDAVRIHPDYFQDEDKNNGEGHIIDIEGQYQGQTYLNISNDAVADDEDTSGEIEARDITEVLDFDPYYDTLDKDDEKYRDSRHIKKYTKAEQAQFYNIPEEDLLKLEEHEELHRSNDYDEDAEEMNRDTNSIESSLKTVSNKELLMKAKVYLNEYQRRCNSISTADSSDSRSQKFIIEDHWYKDLSLAVPDSDGDYTIDDLSDLYTMDIDEEEKKDNLTLKQQEQIDSAYYMQKYGLCFKVEDAKYAELFLKALGVPSLEDAITNHSCKLLDEDANEIDSEENSDDKTNNTREVEYICI